MQIRRAATIKINETKLTRRKDMHNEQNLNLTNQKEDKEEAI